MSNDIDGLELEREIIGLETESRGIGARISQAIREGDLIEADALRIRRERLPLLVQIARAHKVKLEIRELVREAEGLDEEIPIRAAKASLERERAEVIEAECKASILDARHRAAVAIGELKGCQERRRGLEARISEHRARLARIGESPTPATPARETAPVYQIVGGDVRGIG